MAGILNASARKVNASVAGLTGTPQPPSVSTGSPAAPTVTETVGSSLAGIVSGGHATFDFSSKQLAKATDSVKGALGGLKPRGTSVSAPGPAGAVGRLRSAVSALRKKV